MVKNALLAISQLVPWEQVEVTLKSLRIVGCLTRPNFVQILKVVPDIPLKQPHCIEFLSLILQMIQPLVLVLLENDKFLPLSIDFTLMAEL